MDVNGIAGNGAGNGVSPQMQKAAEVQERVENQQTQAAPNQGQGGPEAKIPGLGENVNIKV